MTSVNSGAPGDRASSAAGADEAVERLRADVDRAVRRICPHWLADQAEDLTQIAVSRVIDRQRSADPGTVFTSAYLYRAAYSALIDEIRRRRRLREVPLESDEGKDVTGGSTSGGPERLMAAREIRIAVTACLATLIPARRRAVMLHLLGHSISEAAALLEAGRKNIENLIYRGLADLRQCLKDRGVEP